MGQAIGATDARAAELKGNLKASEQKERQPS